MFRTSNPSRIPARSRLSISFQQSGRSLMCHEPDVPACAL